MQGYEELTEEIISFFLISGNGWMELFAKNEVSEPLELYGARPDRMTIIPGKNGMPSEYVYKVGTEKKHFPVSVTGLSNMAHFKTFHPTNDWYGLSPMEAAALDIDQLNEAGAWNLGLLQNGARPSGAFVVEGKDGKSQNLTENQNLIGLKTN